MQKLALIWNLEIQVLSLVTATSVLAIKATFFVCCWVIKLKVTFKEYAKLEGPRDFVMFTFSEFLQLYQCSFF